MTAPLYYEPTDPAPLREITVDRDSFDRVVSHYGLTAEYDGDRACIELDGRLLVTAFGGAS